MSLMELLVVVIIVGILATIALTQYNKAVELAKVRDAISSLRQIKEGEVIYYYENNTYWPQRATPETNAQTINRMLRVFLDTLETNWDYQVRAPARDRFGAQALRRSGAYVGTAITIDQNGDLGGNWSGPWP